MIKIKNMRHEKPARPWDIKVDRSSILGNPYAIVGRNTIDIVCDAYETYFHKQLGSEDFTYELDRLIAIYENYGQLNLFCWCAPKRCHAETIKQYIERRQNDNVYSKGAV